MGRMADYLVHKFFFGSGHRKGKRRGYQKGSGQGAWRTPSGVILMKDMTDSHLANALIYCDRTGNTGKAEQLREEIERRATAARNS